MEINPMNAAQNYAASRPATAPKAGTGGALNAAMDIARDFTATLRESETTANAAMVGQADPHSLVHALAQTELAVETAVTVRDKVVEAYQEILRMPV